MTHSELQNLFLKYHQEKWPERRAFKNPTGYAKYNYGGSVQFVPYGLPSPIKGRRKKAGGGGSDLVSLGSENNVLSIWFFEIKTKNDKLRSNQKFWRDWVIKNDGKYIVVKEDDSELGFSLIKF